MGLKSAFSAFTSGNFRDSFNYLLTSEDALETQRLVQSAQEANVARQYNEGLVSEQEKGELMNLAAGSAYPFLWENETGGDPAATFGNSLKDATKDVQDKFSNALGGAIGSLPWWIWLLIIGGLLFYFWPFLTVALSFRGKLLK